MRLGSPTNREVFLTSSCRKSFETLCRFWSVLVVVTTHTSIYKTMVFTAYSFNYTLTTTPNSPDKRIHLTLYPVKNTMYSLHLRFKRTHYDRKEDWVFKSLDTTPE